MRLFYDLPSDIRVEVHDQYDFFLYNEIFCLQEYSTIKQALAALDKNCRIVDLGCNVGYFSLYTASILRDAKIFDFQIEAIEGVQETLTKFYHRLLAQPKPTLSGRITLIPGLVGKREGGAHIQQFPHHALNHVCPDSEGAFVPYVDLEKTIAPGKLDLVKCDIEGSETDFIETYKEDFLARTQNLIIEFHHEIADVPYLRGVLGDIGFYRLAKRQHGLVSTELFAR